MKIEIDVIEPLGKEILIRGRFPDSNCSINLFAPVDWQSQKGDRLTIRLDEQRFFIFDHNGRVISD